MLKTTRFLSVARSKFDPAIVTVVPGAPEAGLKLEIVGPVEVVTVKGELEVLEPPGAVTVIGPLEAPAGTTATICVALAEVMDAGVPLNVTAS
jgi:hypothetical protein